MNTPARLALALLILTALPLRAASEYPPSYRWRTIATAHFFIHYHQGEEELARRAAAIAEQVHVRITPLMEYEPGSHRLMHIHHNVPGILRAINDILANRGINIERQVLDTRGNVGYAIYDINRPCDADLMRQLRAVPQTIRVRSAAECK